MLVRDLRREWSFSTFLSFKRVWLINLQKSDFSPFFLVCRSLIECSFSCIFSSRHHHEREDEVPFAVSPRPFVARLGAVQERSERKFALQPSLFSLLPSSTFLNGRGWWWWWVGGAFIRLSSVYPFIRGGVRGVMDVLGNQDILRTIFSFFEWRELAQAKVSRLCYENVTPPL